MNGSRRATAEVPKLRGELGRLREKAQELGQLKAGLAGTTGTDNDPALESAFKTWAARASRLRTTSDFEMPSARASDSISATIASGRRSVSDLMQRL